MFLNFKDPGTQIKSLAKTFFGLELAVGILVGIGCVVGGIQGGVVIILVSPLAAWLSNIVLYAIGDIVENTALIAENSTLEQSHLIMLEQEINELKKQISGSSAPAPAPQKEWNEDIPTL